jgi:hypothetical protein
MMAVSARRFVRTGVLLAALISAAIAAPGVRQRSAPQPSSRFGAQIAALSEPEGFFDTDNLVSNETSYLQVLPELGRKALHGGAYIGVGPDQNFTYIAEVRPSVAFIIDIRRDNLLLHLLFKALFELSRTRVEYLAQLLGRPVPQDLDAWRTTKIDRILTYMETTPVVPGSVDALRVRVDAAIKRTGVPLSAEDFRTIDRFHRRFVEDGLSLRFQSTGRPPQSYYPTYRQLLNDTDASGRQANYLAMEDAFQFVKDLESRDLVVPVVGDIGGPSALAAIGRFMGSKQKQLSAMYVSNVEFYLFGQGSYPKFMANLGRVPHASNSVLIRSVFGRFVYNGLRPGDGSVSRIQPVDDLLNGFAAGRVRQYADIIPR